LVGRSFTAERSEWRPEMKNEEPRDSIGELGFTLVELMIVMVLLGILSGLVMFGLNPFQSAANDAKTTANDDTCVTASALAFTTEDADDNANTFIEDETGC
jgi:prepilin-type N-terminal cleavage/methylation domain-containing protein